MTQLTIVHTKHGSTTRCSVDCVCQNGIWLTECNDPQCQVPGGYIRGLKQFPPNYPMPAIRTELDYYRQWPNQDVVAVVLFNVSDPNISCLEFWH